jgi:hypothetical protein
MTIVGNYLLAHPIRGLVHFSSGSKSICHLAVSLVPDCMAFLVGRNIRAWRLVIMYSGTSDVTNAGVISCLGRYVSMDGRLDDDWDWVVLLATIPSVVDGFDFAPEVVIPLPVVIVANRRMFVMSKSLRVAPKFMLENCRTESRSINLNPKIESAVSSITVVREHEESPLVYHRIPYHNEFNSAKGCKLLLTMH